METFDIDTLCVLCGYFTSDCDINNGYGCKHVDNEYYDDNTGIARCLASACPLGWLSDEDESWVCVTDELASRLKKEGGEN